MQAQSARATAARELVDTLQRRLVDALERVSRARGREGGFAPIEWLRDEGRHGGGVRFVAPGGGLFNRASVNVSQVHYDDLPDKRLGSATALSTIIHPDEPAAPSVHMHISWTELRGGAGYWRVMADLNPSHEEPQATARFDDALAAAIADDELRARARAQGDRYFFIPALGRHRGVTHYYLEGYATADAAADAALARRVGEATIDVYTALLEDALARSPEPGSDARARQLAYHTLYLFQVLTLDRGTTSGLLVHDQNDVGILGSLPSHVDRALLASWRDAMPAPQGELLDGIVAALPDASPSPVTVAAKRALAEVLRRHYRAHPEALDLQAAGDVIPPTVANHR
ncbi:MAG: coproporphyrinogen III oxidase [Myxococcales bacterium]|nr:coproporphyrinogen III oxidase [Myxococcales bacterium]